jgi:hypothetical protein
VTGGCLCLLCVCNKSHCFLSEVFEIYFGDFSVVRFRDFCCVFVELFALVDGLTFGEEVFLGLCMIWVGALF